MIDLLVNHWPVLFVIATIVAALYISLGLRQKSCRTRSARVY